ncbi:ComF family protein [Candidatus Saccharibacteria bacterium]|nr:ComF family protein [Candidatus Saccharibacteria bacterium]
MPFVVKNTTFPSLLDLLAPHSCQGCNLIGSPLCDNCKKYIIENHKDHCPKCKKEKTNLVCPHCQGLPPTFTIDCRNHLLGNLIHDLKYHSVRALARPIAEIMNTTAPDFSHYSTQDNAFNTAKPQNVYLVPLPTIAKHIRTRGLDHTLLLAKQFTHLRGSHYHISPLLIRDKNTVQVGSDRNNRLLQASSAYQLNPKININSSATYILFDDVWTTGASLEAAYNLLTSTGIENIIIFALTYSEN